MSNSKPSTTTKPLEVLCIGTGAIGSIYSFIMTNGGANVTAVARSNYEILNSQGLDIESQKFGIHKGWKPYRAVKTPEQARDRVYDYVLCTFKCTPDLQRTSEVIRPFLKPPSSSSSTEEKLPTIILIQNGVGIEAEVRSSLIDDPDRPPLAHSIISAVAWIGTNLKDGGRRVEHGGLERLEMGIYPHPDSPIDPKSGVKVPTPEERRRLETFAELYNSGMGDARIMEDLESVRWKKVLWNSGWGGLSTLARQPVAKLLTESTIHYSLGVVRRTMLEVLHVARSIGLNEDRLPAKSVDDAINITLLQASVGTFTDGIYQPYDRESESVKQKELSGSLNPTFKPSILIDLESGRPLELVPIFGHIVGLARRNKVDTPRLDMILASLRPYQVEVIQKSRGDHEGQHPVEPSFGTLNPTSKGAWADGAPVSSGKDAYI
ncbi:6-phosphogluconate dehydrogenase C-terminal domain-like protein [Violaceomyces palustris]|uniref:6-phosphogluconate dehydrogenase C-terminal domain-like protein n=1 Tax=Violaceomyces palustris TaxID=1673888 RepID=A0ACD0P855_9BASI|nr:6-phosphogluconate dehydrogenase C-terminal domain-like protein [Violaceomyces palustris]